ncbi:MAG: winged helix-turn-helix domain-containing protein [Fuerstiella sp.]
MADSNVDGIAAIGDTAGEIWGFLAENGPSSLNRISKSLSVSRELVLQAVGWLAREDKLVFEKNSRGRTIRLK